MHDDKEPLLEQPMTPQAIAAQNRMRLAARDSDVYRVWYKQQRRKDRKEFQGTVENEDVMP